MKGSENIFASLIIFWPPHLVCRKRHDSGSRKGPQAKQFACYTKEQTLS